MTVQTHVTSFNNPTTVHTYTIRYSDTGTSQQSIAIIKLCYYIFLTVTYHDTFITKINN